jgi:predicted DNA-binding transcriptional regulator AlpA
VQTLVKPQSALGLSIGLAASSNIAVEIAMTLLTGREAAHVLRLSERTIERLRVNGKGPKFVRINHSVRYRQQDLDAYVAARLVSSTSEEVVR